MLAGVGGRTIDEAKRNISWPEFQAWLAYREAHGILNQAARLERGFALVAHTVASTIPRRKGSKAPKFEDFMPQRAKVQEQAMSLQEAMELMQ